MTQGDDESFFLSQCRWVIVRVRRIACALRNGLLKTELREKTSGTGRQTKWAAVQHQIKRNKNCVLEETKNCCYHFAWVRPRIRKIWRPGVPWNLTCSNHRFGELPVVRNAINCAASFAVHLPTGAITGTFEFLQSCEDICDVHSSNHLADQCLQQLRKPGVSLSQPHQIIIMSVTSRW